MGRQHHFDYVCIGCILMFSTSQFNRKYNPFSQEFRDALAGMANVVGQLQAWDQIISTIAARQAQKIDEGWFHAKITGSSTTSAAARWRYSWTEVVPGTLPFSAADFTVLTGGRSGSSTAVNCLESGNTSGIAYGIAVGFTGGAWKLTTVPFTQMQFKPVPNDTVVQMYTVKIATTNVVRFQFWAPNPIDGTCEP
jgi:hypothetical protein